MFGCVDRIVGTGVVSYPTRRTRVPLSASASAWYCIRGLRAISPSTTTVTALEDVVIAYRAELGTVPSNLAARPQRGTRAQNDPIDPQPCIGPVRRIAIAGGGTAGHVCPALAVAEAFKSRFSNVDLVFLGTSEGFESRLVPEQGIRLELIEARPFITAHRLGKLRSLTSVPTGVREVRRILKAHGTRFVIGLGGYASAAPLLAARSLGLATAVHESNEIPGLTNRMLGRFADRIYAGSRGALGVFDDREVVYTGQPIRREVLDAPTTPKDPSTVRVLVAGGSLGAPFLNERIPALMRRLADSGLRLAVRHQVGRHDLAGVRQAYCAANIDADIREYFDDLPNAYRWADFAITRCGASTLAELAATGLPALLVPMPNHARDHQRANAAAYEAGAGGLVVDELDWNESSLASRLALVLSDRTALAQMSLNASRMAVPDAARRIVDDCERVMRGRW